MVKKPLKNRFKLNLNTVTFASLGLFLVLFVIFWGVWGQSLSGRSSFDLARVKNPIPMRKALREDALTIIVQKDGTIYFNGDKVRPQQLSELIREGVNDGAEQKIYIKADRRAKAGDVNEVVDVLRSAGIENIAFLVEQRKPVTPRPAAVGVTN